MLEYKQGGEGSWKVHEDGALPSTMLEEGAMIHVPTLVERLDEGTTLVLEDFDGEHFEIVNPTEGQVRIHLPLSQLDQKLARFLTNMWRFTQRGW